MRNRDLRCRCASSSRPWIAPGPKRSHDGRGNGLVPHRRGRCRTRLDRLPLALVGKHGASITRSWWSSDERVAGAIGVGPGYDGSFLVVGPKPVQTEDGGVIAELVAGVPRGRCRPAHGRPRADEAHGCFAMTSGTSTVPIAATDWQPQNRKQPHPTNHAQPRKPLVTCGVVDFQLLPIIV